MKLIQHRRHSGLILLLLSFSLVSLATLQAANAGTWNGIEPLKSRREDVLKILGKPVSEDAQGALRFAVAGGNVSVVFVDQKFVSNKKLRADLEGTVLEIVMQHDHSTDTPESMNLLKNHNFIRDNMPHAQIFRNMKEGIVYTFLEGTLHTTRMTFSDSQLERARR